jgi:hypothetical protein
LAAVAGGGGCARAAKSTSSASTSGDNGGGGASSGAAPGCCATGVLAQQPIHRAAWAAPAAGAATRFTAARKIKGHNIGGY